MSQVLSALVPLLLAASTATASQHQGPDPGDHTLTQLAARAYGPLSSAEAAMLAASQSDVALHPRMIDLTEADTWDADRAVRAEVINWLCTDSTASKLIGQFGVQLQGARIDGSLNLSFVDLDAPLTMVYCAFVQPVQFMRSTIHSLQLEGSHLHGGLFAHGMTLRGDLFLRDVVAQRKVTFYRSKIGGQVSCSGAQFLAGPKDSYSLDLEAISVQDSVHLDNIVADKRVSLSGAIIGGDVSMEGAQLRATGTALVLSGARIGGSVLLRDRALGDGKVEHFVSSGSIRLRATRIAIQLSCRGGEFNGGIQADAMEVGGSVMLSKGFASKGEVSLERARLGGNLECVEATFDNGEDVALDADLIQVGGNVRLDGGFSCKGQVRLVGAQIAGSLLGQKSRFVNPEGVAIDAHGLVATDALFDECQVQGEAVFRSASIRGTWQWTNAMPQSAYALDLRFAKFGTLLDDARSWPKQGRLELNGLTYDALHDDAPQDVRSRVTWLSRQALTLQPYEELARVMRQSGNEEGAVGILVEKHRRIARSLQLTSVKWYWYKCLALIGYGYRPFLVTPIAIGVISLGAVLFFIGRKQMLVVDKSAPPLQCLWYSIDAFAPLIDLYQIGYRVPRQPWLRWYLWIHTVTGWALTTLFVVGLTGLVRGL